MDANLIKELENLSALRREMLDAFDEKNEIKNANKEKLDSEIEDYFERKDDFMGKKADTLTGAMPNKSKLCKEKIPVCEAKKISSFSAIVGLVFYAALAIVILSSFLKIQAGISVIVVLVLFVSGFMWLFKNGEISRYFDWEKEFNEWHKEVKKENVNREDLAKKYLDFEAAFEKAAAEYRDFEEVENSKLLLKAEEFEAPYKERLAELQSIIEEDYAKVESNTVLHKDYLGYVDDIIQYLETGRADDLKEAINLAIEEERKAENENARRQEARRQEAILEEQARQNMLHNQAMERAERQRAEDAKIHAARMEQQAKMQLEETKKLRKEMEKQNSTKRY